MQKEKKRYQSTDELTGQARDTVIRLLTYDLLVGQPRGLDLSGDMVRVLVIADRAGAFH